MRLVELLGPTNALELLSSGRLVGSHEAQALGLASGFLAGRRDQSPSEGSPTATAAAAAPSDSLQSETCERGFVLKFMAKHAIASRRTARALKLSLFATRRSDLAPFRVERHCFASTWGNRAHLKALEANLKHNTKGLEDASAATEVAATVAESK